jgi:hypothetical protein
MGIIVRQRMREKASVDINVSPLIESLENTYLEVKNYVLPSMMVGERCVFLVMKLLRYDCK